MTFQLKIYQQDCLEVLQEYFSRASEVGARQAFNERDDLPVKYREVPQLPGLPYVCVRVPTGGGKTVLAAHGVGIATRTYLQADRCVVLWLAPTNAIVEQTLKALRDRAHPYRQALDTDFGGQIEVLSLQEALYVTRATLDGAATIMVSTLAAMRVEETEGRKIYETSGALQAHFSGLSEAQLARLELVDGVITCSLANVLRIRRPLVIMDEAHNARTPLSFDTLNRFDPACILEFTATPDQERSPSNVLYSVSAAELKAEQMVKLPIRMVSRAQWKEAVGAAVTKQRQLEIIARDEEKKTGEYIRPIVLFQAQPKREGHETITVDALRKSLFDDFKIPAEEVAEGTGSKWDLPDNLLTRESPVRYVLTVAALREGWDCPFAYILCSVSNLSSKSAVEQILGRILRLPQAKAKEHPELNVAYAFATSTQFVEAARALEEALVDSGFTKFEAQASIEPDPSFAFGESGGLLFAEPITESLDAAPSLEKLPEALAKAIKIALPVAGSSTFKLTYTGPPLTDEQTKLLKSACKSAEDKTSVEKLSRRSRGLPAYPAAMGESLAIPCLAVRVGKQLEIFEDQYRDAPWTLVDCSPSLSEAEFGVGGPAGQEARVDVDEKGKVQIQFLVELRQQLSFNDLRGPKTESEVAEWLDRAINHPDITQTQSSLFLRRMVDYLVAERQVPLTEVIAARFRLRDVAAQKINVYRTRALTESYRRMLLPDAAMPLEVSPELCFKFPSDDYPANRFYQGAIKFRNHYYERPADMNDEEVMCAAIIDGLPEVRYWVRNLVGRPDYAFWLQTATDKFYPDFVTLLKDGRYLVVEYKGADLMSTDDTKEKRALGELWEARSNGSCTFRLVGRADMDTVVRDSTHRK
jgi:type III restriction enzyme